MSACSRGIGGIGPIGSAFPCLSLAALSLATAANGAHQPDSCKWGLGFLRRGFTSDHADAKENLESRPQLTNLSLHAGALKRELSVQAQLERLESMPENFKACIKDGGVSLLWNPVLNRGVQVLRRWCPAHHRDSTEVLL